MKLDLMETDDAWIELTQNNIHVSHLYPA